MNRTLLAFLEHSLGIPELTRSLPPAVHANQRIKDSKDHSPIWNTPDKKPPTTAITGATSKTPRSIQIAPEGQCLSFKGVRENTLVGRHFKRGHLNHARQQEILKEIGKRMLTEAPQDWKRVVYNRESVIDHSSSSYTIDLENGDSKSPWNPSGLGILFDDLRAGMYQEGKGTWFSMEYIITRPGKFKVHYNYDDDPRIAFPTAWGFTNDLKYFPRDQEHIPAWLHERLRREAEGRATE